MRTDSSTYTQPLYTQPLAPDGTADRWAVAWGALQQRELLAPFLLLSAGYVALPLIAKPILLLLTPVIELLGFSLSAREE